MKNGQNEIQIQSGDKKTSRKTNKMIKNLKIWPKRKEKKKKRDTKYQQTATKADTNDCNWCNTLIFHFVFLSVWESYFITVGWEAFYLSLNREPSIDKHKGSWQRQQAVIGRVPLVSSEPRYVGVFKGYYLHCVYLCVPVAVLSVCQYPVPRERGGWPDTPLRCHVERCRSVAAEGSGKLSPWHWRHRRSELLCTEHQRQGRPC